MAEENQELRKAGLKVTLPRVKILQILETSQLASGHMSAEDVYMALRTAGEPKTCFTSVRRCDRSGPTVAVRRWRK